jgi:hypothetical protein
MSRDYPQLRVRISPELKYKLEAAALDNNRTLTAEIEHRLQQSFSMPLPELGESLDQNPRAYLSKWLETVVEQTAIIKKHLANGDFADFTPDVDDQENKTTKDNISEETKNKKGFGDFS